MSNYKPGNYVKMYGKGDQSEEFVIVRILRDEGMGTYKVKTLGENERYVEGVKYDTLKPIPIAEGYKGCDCDKPD